MLRIIQNTGVSGAMHYFTSADYFSEGQELEGQWHGKAAAQLGLSGEIKKKDWDSLCQNRDPHSGKPLTPRLKTNRRVGYDFNFRAPKSLSLLYGLTGDERLLDAFRSAFGTTMREMEAEMQTRVRQRGQDIDRVTGNMVWGEWVHFTGRPVDGVPDPHLHAHCFVFNVTQDEVENRWKAGQFAGLKRDAPYFEAVFHSRLAERLGDLGLAVERGKSGWEIAGLSKTTLEKFSRRSQLIEEKAKAQGITDPEAKMTLSAKTREKKRTELSLIQLSAQWANRLTAEETASLRQLMDRIGTGPVERDPHAADRAAELAVSHMFERKAVVPERMLLRDALKRSIGQASVEATERVVRDQPLILADSGDRRFATTQNVLTEEQKMIAFARDSRGTCRALAPGEHLFKDQRLNTQQRAAVHHVLHSHDLVTLVVGGAGTGKTTMMRETIDAIEAAGTKVFAFAPSADASRVVLREEKFDADTVAMLLKNEKLQDRVRNNVWWIDEAGLLSTPTMKQLFDLAAKLNARLVLSGDRKQHGSVERGDALRQLETEAGIKPAEVREIQRQSGRYKDAVRTVEQGRLKEGFTILNKLEWIKEIPDAAERYDALAADYIASTAGKGKCLVVSPTHAEADRATEAIRLKLRAVGRLKGAEREVLTLKNLNLTEAERTDRINYLSGDVLVYHQNAPCVRKGTRLIAGQDKVPFDQAARFQVYRPNHLRLAKGDLIRITSGGKSIEGHALVNGATFHVKDFTRGGDLILGNGWHVARDYGHIAYGYVSTSHGAQGKTVPRVLIVESSRSLPAASREQFYVSLSRGKQSAAIYTNDREALLEAVSQSEDRMSATDLMRQRYLQGRAVIRQQFDQAREPSTRERQREAIGMER